MELPLPFVTRIKSQLQLESKSFLASLDSEPPVSIRINNAKKITVSSEHVPWCSTGFYLESRPVFTLDPHLHAGCYYVQDASSMILEQVFLQLGLSGQKLLLLDACAAPGGKTTHLASLMGEDSLLVSNEVIASRISVLKENVIKWGHPNVVITGSDPSAFTDLENLFDVMLVDAPCSGEGLFRRDHESVAAWSETNCELNAARQQRILSALLPSLKPGGILLYSTCTFNPAENQRNVKWLTETQHLECMELKFPETWGIMEVRESKATGYAFYPHRVRGEGLFISVLRKAAGPVSSRGIKSSKLSSAPSAKKISAWINPEGYELIEKDGFVIALPQAWSSLIGMLSRNLKVIYSGCTVAEIKNKPIPDHALAMSTLLNKNAFPATGLTTEQALKYLRKQDFGIHATEKGFTLMQYEGFPLGWINHLGNRFNNYYPVNWRIRMQ